MQNLTETVKEFNSLVQQFKFEEALERFYDDNVIAVDNEGIPTVGLAAYREAARKFIDNISNHTAEIKDVIVSEDMSVTEWHYKFDHQMAGTFNYKQLSLQRWKDGKIIHERHHY